ncbi:MAG: hypothetical protein WKF82_07200 [Nocardioidaceae bacterium]
MDSCNEVTSEASAGVIACSANTITLYMGSSARPRRWLAQLEQPLSLAIVAPASAPSAAASATKLSTQDLGQVIADRLLQLVIGA